MNFSRAFWSHRSFTLLEVMIAIFLLAISGTIVGIRLTKALDEKEFQAAIDRLHSELESSHHLALNMQADWSVVLEKRNNLFYLGRSCPEAGRSVTVQWKAPCRLIWNDEPIEKIAFLFSSTGKIEPAGVLQIVGSHQLIQWSVPEVFAISERTDGMLPRPE